MKGTFFVYWVNESWLKTDKQVVLSTSTSLISHESYLHSFKQRNRFVAYSQRRICVQDCAEKYKSYTKERCLMDRSNTKRQSSNVAMSFNDKNDLPSKPTVFTRTQNLDTHTLIWLDTSIYAHQIHMQLRSIIDNVLLIDTIDSCIEQTMNNKEQIFLIVSDQYEEKLIPTIHNLHQLNSIFIFSANKTPSERWTKEYSKVRGVYDNFELLKTDLKSKVETFLKHERMMPELFNPNNEAFTMNILRYDLWLIKLLYVLIRQKPPANSKEYFVNIFSFYYKDNSNNEQLLEEFSHTYDPSKAIWWYTKDTFIYRVLNKALRERNIQIICAFHFFIRDLYEQIEHAHRLFNETTSSMHVYRGQIMNKKDIERIEQANNLDLRLSINPLLSTTLDRGVAFAFIVGFEPTDDCRGVLFEIECNANLTSRPFAEVNKESNFQGEQEVLFMPGAAFAVNSIEFDELNQLSIIKLRLCDEQEIQKGTHKKNMFKGDRDTVRELFDDMGTSTIVHGCSDLEQLYNYMIKLFSSDELIEFDYLNAMGSKSFTNKNFELSIDCYKRSLTLKQKICSSEHRQIAELYYWIAESYYRLKDYNPAIDFYHKAIDCSSLLPSNTILAHLYLGYSYLERENSNNCDGISSAKYHLQTALYIDLENEILHDAKIVDIYQALADINEYQDNLDSAIDYCTRALEICERNEWTDESNEFKEKIQAIKL